MMKELLLESEDYLLYEDISSLSPDQQNNYILLSVFRKRDGMAYFSFNARRPFFEEFRKEKENPNTLLHNFYEEWKKEIYNWPNND